MKEWIPFSTDKLGGVVRLLEGVEELLDNKYSSKENVSFARIRIGKALWDLQVISLVPLVSKLQSAVFKMAEEKQKFISWKCTGEWIAIPRVLEEAIFSSLLHLIRNTLAHGVESLEERRKLNKTEIGVCKLSFELESDWLNVEFSDDGRGVSAEYVLSKAIEFGHVSKKEAPNLSKEEILRFLFKPGWSLGGDKNSLSGRGMGLSAIEDSMSEVGGKISAVESEPGQGFKIQFKIPVSLVGQSVISLKIDEGWFCFSSEEIETEQKNESEDKKQEIKNIKFYGEAVSIKVKNIEGFQNTTRKLFRPLDHSWKQIGPSWIKKWLSKAGDQRTWVCQMDEGDLGVLVNGKEAWSVFKRQFARLPK